MAKANLHSGVNIRMWTTVKEDLRIKAREIGITPSTLARLIIEGSLSSGNYKNIELPRFLLPSQEYREAHVDETVALKQRIQRLEDFINKNNLGDLS